MRLYYDDIATVTAKWDTERISFGFVTFISLPRVLDEGVRQLHPAFISSSAGENYSQLGLKPIYPVYNQTLY
jgi:hypothetical protein